MILSPQVEKYLEGSSLIRKMFTEGIRLKKLHGPENVFDFSLGNPDLPTTKEVHEAIAEIVNEAPQPYQHGYCPNAGLPELRTKLAEKLSEYHKIEVSSEEVLVTTGAAGAINAFFRAVLSPGDEVISPTPYFVEYGFYAQNHGAQIVTVETKPDFQLDIAAIEEAINKKTRVIIINSPNNPTGQVYPYELLQELADMLEKKGKELGRPIYLLSDEPYRHLIFDNQEVSPILSLFPYAVVASSFSKDLSLAGERIGYIAISPLLENRADLAGALSITNRILGFVNAPILIQRALVTALDSRVDMEIYAKRRDLFASILTEAGYEFQMPKGAFYFFPKSPIEDDKKFVQLLKDELILAVPGSAFGRKGHFRLTFCIEESSIANSAAGFKRAMEKAKKE